MWRDKQAKYPNNFKSDPDPDPNPDPDSESRHYAAESFNVLSGK
jgi:hypothetical protein